MLSSFVISFLSLSLHASVPISERVSDSLTVISDSVNTPPNQLYISLRTNLLADACAVPDIAADFYIGHNLSIAPHWMYAWWRGSHHPRYWRIYGGDVTLRYWFGRERKIKPLTGHHVGIYAGALTFDFAWGRSGYMGGLPGGTLWDRCVVNVGMEYGYSLPILRRLSLDFTLGVGYMSGKVERYDAFADRDVWKSTTRRTWFGPTRAELSLVWLIGRDNYNGVKKGGGI